ncbi:type IV secretion protein Rhs, partial [Pedobacter yulinensis]
YDDQGNLTHVYDRAGKSIRFGYDEQNRVTGRRNRNGMQYIWRYDKQGRVTHTEGEGGYMRGEIRYHPDEGYNEVIYHKDKIEQYWYDQDQLVYKKVDALGGETWYEYNRYNEQTMMSSPEGKITGQAYDEMGNPVTWYLSDGTEHQASYDAYGRMLSRTDGNGLSERWSYDESGRLVLHQDKDGSSWAYFYSGDKPYPAGSRNQNGLEITWTYNEQHQLVEAKSSAGLLRSWAYDTYGRLIRFIAENGSVSEWDYDDLGRTTAVRETDKAPLSFAYDAYDLPVAASDGREAWTMKYTAMGSLLMQSRKRLDGPEEVQTLRFRYDDWDALQAIHNEKDEVYRFVRDATDEIIAETGFDGATQRYERNKDGEVERTIRPDGTEVRHYYDLAGRMVYSRYPDGSYEALTYDKNGLLIEAENTHTTVRIARDALGRVKEEDQNGHKIKYSYDVLGNLSQVQTSLGANVTYRSSPDGASLDIDATAGTKSWRAAFRYNASDQETERLLPGNLRQQFDYDRSGRPVLQKVARENTINTYRQYAWGPDDRLNEVLNNITGGRVTFRYTAFGSLSSATYPQDLQTEYRNPDETGNLFRTVSRNDRRYDAGGQLLKDDKWYYRYDALGNLVLKSKRNINALPAGPEKVPADTGLFDSALTWKTALPGNATDADVQPLPDAAPGEPIWQPGDWAYEWQHTGLLKAVRNPEGATTEFEYDAMGRRTAKISGGQITRYLWDGSLLFHEWAYSLEQRPSVAVSPQGEVTTSAPEPLTGLVTWIYDQSNFTPVARLGDAGSLSIISDHLATPVEAYDGHGQLVWSRELDIYGKVRKMAGQASLIPFLFQGQYLDEETGLAYNRFRYYDPQRGDYISKDPIGLYGGLSLYSYVADPNSWTDVFGLAGELGAWGEKVAAKYLRQQGHQILGSVQNASGHGFDLITKTANGDIHVIEVKTSQSHWRSKSNMSNWTNRNIRKISANRNGRWGNKPQYQTDLMRTLSNAQANAKLKNKLLQINIDKRSIRLICK